MAPATPPKSKNPWKSGTQRYFIGKELLAGKSREEVYMALAPMVMDAVEPMVFKTNGGSSRVPISPIEKQLPLLFFHIGRVRETIEKEHPDLVKELATESEKDKTNYGSAAWRSRFLADNSDNLPEAEKEKPKKAKPETQHEYLYRRLVELRDFLETKKTVSNTTIDFISKRPFVEGNKAIAVGIHPDDILRAITAAWSQDNRREAGIKEVKYDRFWDGNPDYDKHFGYILKLCEARIPNLMVGPSGSGKSFIARQIAEHLGVKYGECPLTAGATPSWLLGSWNREGFSSRPFLDIYENGGVFCFEEIDASDPNMILIVNNALAANELHNPVNGKIYKKSENFICTATANTFGIGANKEYTGRERLDAATRDRFRCGIVEVGYDLELERRLLFKGVVEAENDTAE